MVKTKTKIKESYTNLVNLGQLPADEVLLNTDVFYNSILDQICSVVQMDSPRQVVSCLKLIHDSEQKSINKNADNKDAYYTKLMSEIGAMPLDDNGYVTNLVRFQANNNKFIGNFKNILPGTVKIGNELVDDGQGSIVNKNKEQVGTVDYEKAVFNVTLIETPSIVEYKFDIYNLETSRIFAKFIKTFVEVFAEMFQLDVDSAVVLDNFKGLNLKDNIDNILPQVLSQQIDQHVLSKYFEQIDNNLVDVVEWDANSIDMPYNQGYSATDFYKDFGTKISLQMTNFARKNGVIPNIILCDPISYPILSISHKFIPSIDKEETKNISTPKLVGIFDNAKVFLVQNILKQEDETKLQGRVVLTFKGDSDAATAAVFGSFIPVTLRTVDGAEGNGMIVTKNAYSIGGFNIINPELINGVKIVNLKI